MDGLHLHEPIASLTHAAGALLGVPGTIALVRRARGRRAAAALYGATLVACLLASAVFHGAVVDEPTRDRLCRIDHCGIFLLIAGTYTPILTHSVVGAPWRRELGAVWLAAGTGGGVILVRGLLPPALATTIYLVLGWSALALYAHLRRTRPAAEVNLLMEGGAYYSVGAAINLAGWPAPWPGVVGAHEVFHVLVLAGALAHYVFLYRLLGPAADRAIADRDRRAERGHRMPSRSAARTAKGRGARAHSPGRRAGP